MLSTQIKNFTLIGEASSVRKKISYEADVEKTLMEFLHLQNIPIASSCLGEGICKKCQVKLNHRDVLSCQVLLKDLPSSSEVNVGYL